jgi:hypothetical protein
MDPRETDRTVVAVTTRLEAASALVLQVHARAEVML